MKVLGFGSMNIDYVYSVEHILTPGETISSSGREVFAGGKGLNQSIAVAKAGLEVWHAGILGAGGEMLLDTLKENGVNISLIRKSVEAPGHTVIQVDAKGQNCILLYGGTNRQITPEYIDEVMGHFDPGDLLLVQNEVNLLDEIIDKAYSKRLKVVINPSPFDKAVGECDLKKISLFLVNEIEAEQISGLSSKEPEKILDWFSETYPEAQVVLTMGVDGAWYNGNEGRFFQPVFPVKAVDTTAAGDTFTGYFLEGWSAGRGIAKSLERAAKASSIAVSRKGAAPSIPFASELGDE